MDSQAYGKLTQTLDLHTAHTQIGQNSPENNKLGDARDLGANCLAPDQKSRSKLEIEEIHRKKIRTRASNNK